MACSDPVEPVEIPEVVDFNFHVRPILSNNCFLCHGPDPSSREADLRLDEFEFATASREGGLRAIFPGNADKSEVIRRIVSEDPDYRMPPPETNKQLTAREIAILRKWIDDGAEWKPWWAFIPPKSEPLFLEQTGHPVDRYLDRSRESAGVSSAPVARPEALIRRLSYVLTGLPPKVEDVKDFVSQPDSAHYTKWVDNYLDSPAFGERWARHWMDLVRYAEGKGHEFDYPVNGAWRYRDYLIRALNADVPYDQLVREHLAGDMLSEPRYHPSDGFNESRLATGFFQMSEGKHSPVDIKEEEKIMIDNIIDVTSKTFMGLTVACARCHDHKFDPIPTTDYYSLYGIFESMRTHFFPANQGLEEIHLSEQIDSLKSGLREMLASQVPESDLQPRAMPVAATTDDAIPENISVLADWRDGGLDGWNADGLAFGGVNQLGAPVITDDGRTSLSRGLVSSRHYGTGVMGALRSPTFTIDQRYIIVEAAGQQSMIRLVVDNFQLIQDPIHGGLDHELNNEEMQTYVIDLKMVQGHQAYLELLPGRMVRRDGKFHYYDIPPNAWIEATYAVMVDSAHHYLPQKHVLSAPDPYQSLQKWVGGDASAGDVKSLQPAFRRISPAIWEQPRNNLLGLGRNLYDSTFIAGVVEGDGVESPVFIRGDHQQRSDSLVPHRFLTALADQGSTFTASASGRLELAEAIVDQDNPLTARVMVNRIWHHLFGRGLVASVDNFGLQGTIPDHLPLLDHLALYFMEHDWSVKQLIRYLVTSRTFQQAAEAVVESDSLDPQNIYWHHYPVRRLEAEAIRDGILATSGRLDTTMFGPSIPIHLTSFLSGRGRPPRSGPLDGEGRRSVYQSVWRNFLPPMMLTFDMPIPFTTFGNRSVTNVPAQSLTLLNDPFVTEQAAVWAERLVAELQADQRIERLYWEAFSRSPSPEEVSAARDFLKVQANNYSVDLTKDPDHLQVWTDLCHSVFNMKEFIYLL